MSLSSLPLTSNEPERSIAQGEWSCICRQTVFFSEPFPDVISAQHGDNPEAVREFTREDYNANCRWLQKDGRYWNTWPALDLWLIEVHNYEQP